MWDLSILSSFENDRANSTDISDLTAMRSVKTCYADTLMIRTRIANALTFKKKQCPALDGSVEIKRLHHEIQKLNTCRDKVDQYLEKLEDYREIEDLVADCQDRKIDPKHRIIWGGRTLQVAIDEMNRFFSQSDPLQGFDCLYE